MRTPLDPSRLAHFNYAIITVVGTDNYPYSIPTEFEVSPDKRILLKKPPSNNPLTAKRVGVLFNHISAIPTGGYADRRYILIWGRLSDHDGKLELHPETLTEWDEKILPFPELCARAAPQGQKYLQDLQRQVEA